MTRMRKKYKKSYKNLLKNIYKIWLNNKANRKNGSKIKKQQKN